MENTNQNDLTHSKLDDAYESDGEIGNVLDSEEYNKLNYIRKLEELVKKGHNFTKNYSMTNSVEELKYAYISNVELFDQNIIKNDLIETREYFLKESNLQYYVDDLNMTGFYASKLIKNSILQYIIKHDQELWKKLTKIILHVLRSEITQKYINVGFEFLERDVSLLNQYINSFKSLILNEDENRFTNLKKSTIEKNYKFIQMVKDNEEIEYENKQDIIKLLIKINSIIEEIKEKRSEIILQVEEIISSEEKILEFVGQFKDFVLTNLDCTIKHDIFYYNHIIPCVEHNLLTNYNN